MPALSTHRLYALVPDDITNAHSELMAATHLAGVHGRKDLIEAADDTLLEVAALLCGREPRGFAQRRFVDARLAVMRETTTRLRERHAAWTEAKAEVDELAVALPAAPVEARAHISAGVRALVVVLFPFFASWDLFVGVGRGLVACGEGVVIGLRATLRCWQAARQATRTAIREARRNVSSLRLRVRLQLRRATRQLRRVVS